jgi:hypothetical protein
MPAIGMVRPAQPTQAQKDAVDRRIIATQRRLDNLMTSKIGPDQKPDPNPAPQVNRPDR